MRSGRRVALRERWTTAPTCHELPTGSLMFGARRLALGALPDGYCHGCGGTSDWPRRFSLAAADNLVTRRQRLGSSIRANPLTRLRPA